MTLDEQIGNLRQQLAAAQSENADLLGYSLSNAGLRRELTAAQAELKEAWDSIGEHPVGFDLATCIESLKAQNESLTERVTKLKAELAAARADLDSIAKAVYPSKEPRFTYSVQFMVEEIVKARMDTERLRELLWMAWSNGMGYGDDGELQFAGMDFKRDSLELLERKMYERNLPAVKAFLEARERGAIMPEPKLNIAALGPLYEALSSCKPILKYLYPDGRVTVAACAAIALAESPAEQPRVCPQCGGAGTCSDLDTEPDDCGMCGGAGKVAPEE
jgi:regulator of replication initiation timing